MRVTYYFARLGRPLFLAGGVVFHGLGVLVALYRGATLNVPALIWGQMVVTAVQLMTHYSNDYFDLAADQANQTPTRWSGGSRVLADGRLAPRVALVAAVVLGSVALAASLWLALAIRPGGLALPLLLLALFLAWSYSAPPLQLNARGLGEITGAFLIPGLTVLAGFYLQAGRLEWLPFLAIFPLSCLQLAMLLAINFPDAAGDAAAAKKTLVIRWGPGRTIRLYLAALAAPYVTLPLSVVLGLPGTVALAVLACFPLALWQGRRMARGAWARPAQWNSLGFWSIGLLMCTAVAECLAFLWLCGCVVM
ncbi:MAG: prenyltransferase [Chloroflexi bacterium]|nr:prenyltransferase [Chloroflexota bacterium]MCI0577030.1 prenyltransferase [Chloroflexota bacterium]MCI0648814.1 prenyltransferase [Chloroflexota bacterium]MCI0726316.1 prenyltransferase [Chloroflexota bacterium]